MSRRKTIRVIAWAGVVWDPALPLPAGFQSSRSTGRPRFSHPGSPALPAVPSVTL